MNVYTVDNGPRYTFFVTPVQHRGADLRYASSYILDLNKETRRLTLAKARAMDFNSIKSLRLIAREHLGVEVNDDGTLDEPALAWILLKVA